MTEPGTPHGASALDTARLRETLAAAPYAVALGLSVDAIDAGSAILRLPYQDGNSNPGRVLHGGVAASLVAAAGEAVARAALGAASGPWHTAAIQVAYLAAAIGEEVVARGSLLRAGRELCFVDVSVETTAGKAVAHGLVVVRGRFGASDAGLPRALPDDGAREPGPMGPHIARAPFMGRLGLRVEHMQGGRARLVLPFRDQNASESGGVHEGALLALLDTAGAMAGWAETGPGRFKASTPAIQARILAPPPRAELVAQGRLVHRDREHFVCDVEVAAGEAVVALGTVTYRIVTEGPREK